MQDVQNNTMLQNELPFITNPGGQHTDSLQSSSITPPFNSHACIYCNLYFNNKCELHNHCQTEKHQQIIMSDSGRYWHWRPPPRCFNTHNYVMCKDWSETESCNLGNLCLQAHGLNELNEWNERLKYRQMRLQHAVNEQLFGDSYTHQLLDKVKCFSNPHAILKDHIEFVQDSCSSSLTTTVISKLTVQTWTFVLKSFKPLCAVALLHDSHRTYFQILGIVVEVESRDIIYDIPNTQEWLSTNDNKVIDDYKYKVTIKFCTDAYGTFRQSVVFDFGVDSILCKDLCADVVPKEQAQQIEKIQQEITLISKELWTVDNSVIVPFTTTDTSYNENCINENDWKQLYPIFNGNKFVLTSDVFTGRLSENNYRQHIHTLLYLEEIARHEQITKFNVTAKLHVVDKCLFSASTPNSITKYSSFGELYAYINLSQDLSEDTSWGRLLLHSCSTVLISLEGTKVYEAIIEEKGKNTLYLRLGAATVKGLDLKTDHDFTAQLQFQLNRLPFCEWHFAVDKIPDLKIIFPEKYLEPLIPWSPEKQWGEGIESQLNVKQKEALIAITTKISIQIPPILLIGPFGTGKTFTLAKAVTEILKQDGTKILICTHSNSAADIYIKDYFHEYYKSGHIDAKPLRVYYQKRWVFSVHPIVQQYCLIKEDKGGRQFYQPTLDDIEKHRIVVVTLSTSLYLSNLGLQKGCFSHILLDEAAQTIECAAIMPFFLSTQTTRIVLAGDHMQLSPEIYSKQARDCNLHVSLLERLYNHYPTTFPCKILLTENYRAHEAIVNFTSEMFYEQKMVATGKQTRHPKLYPLTFFTVRGEDVQDINSTGFYNMSEVYEIVERVSELKNNWPKAWKPFTDQSIGILAPYSDQVFRIRCELRKRRLGNISVERVLNVQGKQFRVIVLSVVRTGRTCTDDAKSNCDYGFLSDSKLLNTAVTRAQSLIIVVGDPIALCTIGRCSKVWERFLGICSEHNSLNGITWSNLKFQLDGLELKKLYGLNPLAPEFVPRMHRVQGMLYRNIPQAVTTVYVSPTPPPPPPLPSFVSTEDYIRCKFPEGDLIQLLDKVHIPNAHSLHDLMNLLPQNMSLANVLKQPPSFHLQWYNYLLRSKGLEAAKRFEYLISVTTNERRDAINMVGLSPAKPDEILLPVDLPYVDQKLPNLNQYHTPINQINFDKPVYHLINSRGEVSNVQTNLKDPWGSTRLYQRQSMLYNGNNLFFNSVQK